MLYTVTLTQDVRPWRAGDKVHVEKGLADLLIERGEATDKETFQTEYMTKVVDPEPTPEPAKPAKIFYKTKRGRPRRGA